MKLVLLNHAQLPTVYSIEYCFQCGFIYKCIKSDKICIIKKYEYNNAVLLSELIHRCNKTLPQTHQ